MYCTAPKGGAGNSVRNNTKSVLGGSPDALKCKLSVPRSSALSTTLTSAFAFGKQLATASLAGTSVKLMGSGLMGSGLSSFAVAGPQMNIDHAAAMAANVETGFMTCLPSGCGDS